MKVFVAFGTRPETIKLAPVIHELKRRSKASDIQTVVCVTGQHREMLDQFLTLFNINPDYDLDIMVSDQTPSDVAASILSKLPPLLRQEHPDWVIVQGDTSSVVASSIASYYSRIPLAHVEAGLRTYDKWQPFPEELNRRITGVIADLHLAPTNTAKANLIREGVPENQILVTGNPVIDSLQQISDQPAPENLLKRINDIRQTPNKDRLRLILVTAHRRESFGPGMEAICLALKDLANRYQDKIHFLYSVHLNPEVSKPAHSVLGDVSNITLLPPLDYLSMVHLMKNSYLVLTDSGGIQEEAPSLGKPVLVLRNVTERPEAVESGTVKVIGTNRDLIVSEVTQLLEEPTLYQRMAESVNPYGDGKASARIVSALLQEDVEPFRSA